MNFYEFYQLINENTVTQELKRFSKQKEYNEDFIEKSTNKVFLGIKQSVTDDFNDFNNESIRILAKWVVYNAIKKEKNDDHPYASPILQLNPTVGNSRLEDLYRLGLLVLSANIDFLAANIDQNGNLNPQIASKFNNINFTSDDLVDLSTNYHENLKKKQRNKPGRVGNTVLSFPDGYSWVDLERGYCEIEKDTMGHCGNVGAKPGDTILSLRDKKNTPHLTFILNNGVLGEMKGRGNDKPAPKYHPYIIELLKLPIIKGVKGGGYLPENNFKLNDLNDNQLEELLKTKPKLKNSLIMGKFEDGLLANLTPWTDIDSLIEKAKEPELKLIFKFWKFLAVNSRPKSQSINIDEYFTENELLMLLNNETINFIDKNHVSGMGEKLEIDRKIAEGTSNENVQMAVIEKHKTNKNPHFRPGRGRAASNPIHNLCINKNTSENVQKQILKNVEDIELSLDRSTHKMFWLKILSRQSEYPDVLKQIFYIIEKNKKDLEVELHNLNLKPFKKQMQVSDFKADVRIVYTALNNNKNTPKEILPQVKLGIIATS